MNLNSLNMFVLIVQHGGFSEAARKVDIPVATLSRHLGELEKQLGIRLLERSTRQIRTTSEGEILYRYAVRGIDEINAGKLAIIDASEQLKGSLRLSIPTNLDFWWKLLSEFQEVYPNVSLDIFTTDRLVDLIADGVDVAVRIGELKTQSAIARQLAEYRHFIVYSPGYREKYGIPPQPQQLTSYPCGAWRNIDKQYVWNLGGKDFPVHPKLRVNDFAHLLKIALDGEIITELPPLFAKPYLDSGQLIKLFPDLPMPKLSLNLLYPSRKYVSPITRAYIDFSLAYCKREITTV